MVSRRRVLLGVAAGSVAGGAGATLVLRLEAPAPGARVLSARELDVVRAIGEVVLPAGVFPIDGTAPAVLAEVDRTVADMLYPAQARGFRYILRTLEYGSIARHGLPFTRLPAQVRKEIVDNWHDPALLPRRVAWDSVRVVLGMAFFAQPEVTAEMGWRALCGGGGSG
jgi:hypothetical protein